MSEHAQGTVFSEDLRTGAFTFVGDFDGLYNKESDPWGQAGEGIRGAYYRHSRQAVVDAILESQVTGLGLEIGCGHGHLTRKLQNETPVRWSGMDISRAAVTQAIAMHPSVNFVQGNLLDEKMIVSNLDVVVLSQMLWYILHQLDRAVRNTALMVRPGGLLVVTQAFIKGEQRYGRDVIDGFEGARHVLSTRYRDLYELVLARYEDRPEFSHADGLIVMRRCQ